MHERVHDPLRKYARRGRIILPSVEVYCHREPYCIYGVPDCLELKKAADGVPVKGFPDRYEICIVEYKPTQPKGQPYRQDDLMQVFAQKLCTDHVFGCDCDAELYYGDTGKRVSLPLRENYEEYDVLLRQVLSEIRAYLEKGEIPPVRKSQNCGGCSLKDVCMPHLRKKDGIRKQIMTMMGGGI